MTGDSTGDSCLQLVLDESPRPVIRSYLDERMVFFRKVHKLHVYYSRECRGFEFCLILKYTFKGSPLYLLRFILELLVQFAKIQLVPLLSLFHKLFISFFLESKLQNHHLFMVEQGNCN